MKNIFFIGVLFFVLNIKTHADEAVLGWGNLPDCSRLVSSDSDLFGDIIPDTYESTEQRVYVILGYNNLSQLQSYEEAIIKNCAITSAAVTGIACLAANFACAPAFWSSFSSCVANYSVNSDDLGLELRTRSECVGW